jgi:Flp pilus assembly protein TadG
MLRSIRKFLGNRKGAFAMQFALMAVPLTVCTGLAIDGGRAFLARYELSAALDAAALAVGSTTSEGADLNLVAHTFVNANFHGDHEGPITLDLDNEDDTILLKGQVTINTYFMPLVGQPSVTVSAESEVKKGGNNVEVALALDVTESMDGTRMDTLRVAATDLINTVVNDLQTPYYSRVAIVPWANNVYVGDYADAIRGDMDGPTAITAAFWRDGTMKTISGAAWRNGTAKNITGATWRNGSAVDISVITKVASPAAIRVTTSVNHGYANGQYVRITGANGSYTSLNNNVYVVELVPASTTMFYLRNLTNTAYITPPSGSTNSTSTTDASQRCFSATCEIQVTAASHGFATGDWVYITGVNGMTSINNTASATWVVGATATNTFILTGSNGPSSSNFSATGTPTASKCFTAVCEVRVTTSASHGFSNGDLISIRNVGGMTQINNTNGNTWTIGSVTSTTFMLPGSVGTSYGTYTASTGNASECFAAGCEVIVTSAGHGLANGDHVQISGVGGTNINVSGNTSWLVEAVSGDNFRLDASVGPNLGDYSGGGQVQCLEQGCLSYRYTNVSGSTVIRPISECVSERVGSHQYDDAAPSETFVGRDYAGAGIYVDCETANPIIPLTDDKTVLKDAIQDMVVTGSTAGQMGTAWGWYLVSPDWGYLWPDAKNKPAPYGTKELAKVVVLMTDGEFNTAHCNGVVSSNWGVSNNSDRGNCNATNGKPFGQSGQHDGQSEKLCDAMKAQAVIVYTVGFELNVGGDAESFMNYCATDPQHAFLTSSPDELKAAFKSIATSISQLRISK